MNLSEAVNASPYRSALCETTDGRTFYVEPDESDEHLERFDLKVAQGAMPAEVIRSYNWLGSLVRSLADYPGDPQADADWLPIGEGGEVIQGSAQ